MFHLKLKWIIMEKNLPKQLSTTPNRFAVSKTAFCNVNAWKQLDLSNWSLAELMDEIKCFFLWFYRGIDSKWGRKAQPMHLKYDQTCCKVVARRNRKTTQVLCMLIKRLRKFFFAFVQTIKVTSVFFIHTISYFVFLHVFDRS